MVWYVVSDEQKLSSLGRFGSPKCHQSEHESYCAVADKKEIRLTEPVEVLYSHKLFTRVLYISHACLECLHHHPTLHSNLSYWHIPI